MLRVLLRLRDDLFGMLGLNLLARCTSTMVDLENVLKRLIQYE